MSAGQGKALPLRNVEKAGVGESWIHAACPIMRYNSYETTPFCENRPKDPTGRKPPCLFVQKRTKRKRSSIVE
jgi:hypothetical protein